MSKLDPKVALFAGIVILSKLSVADAKEVESAGNKFNPFSVLFPILVTACLLYCLCSRRDDEHPHQQANDVAPPAPEAVAAAPEAVAVLAAPEAVAVLAAPAPVAIAVTPVSPAADENAVPAPQANAAPEAVIIFVADQDRPVRALPFRI